MLDALRLPFFQTAALAALVLAGIHAYLGFHIVRRGVLFVDLALAQMAALGVALSVVLGREHDEVGSYLLALGMTMLGAALFAWLRGRARHAPLEAFIGIVFATAQALAFLLLEKTPSGAEHIKETLVGSLFTVAPRHIAVVAGLYAVVSIVHFVLRKPFMEITNDPEGAKARGRRVFLWDFLFYATFGVVVTSAVQIAGVLLVFGFLVIPAVAGVIATPRTGLALAIGWAFAFGSSVVGLLLSVTLDLPAAPSILVTLTAMLLVHGMGVSLLGRRAGGSVAPTH
jgi:zinc/manganese transport system permease protein